MIITSFAPSPRISRIGQQKPTLKVSSTGVGSRAAIAGELIGVSLIFLAFLTLTAIL